jgi:hypothetical protein
MKKVLLTICLSLMLIIMSTTVNAQSTPFSLNVQGGYSWLNGVVGAEAQFGKIGLSGGWMPCKMPMSGTKVNSIGLAATYYTLPANQEGYSAYISAGVASDGYRYEDSWGDEAISPMTIVMIGSKYDSGDMNCKLGIGYGWCDEAGVFTFEITLGFSLFSNK